MFNFWPFNVARKRREAQETKLEAALRARLAELQETHSLRNTMKRNKVIPLDDPRHPRNLSPQQRADRIAAMRPELGMPYAGSKGTTSSSVQINRHNLPREPAHIGVDYASGPDVTVISHLQWEKGAPPEVVVQQFRCDHPAISEFWQEQQARCDSPTDTGSASCDAPSTDQ